MAASITSEAKGVRDDARDISMDAFDTGPPDELAGKSALQILKTRMVDKASALLLPVIQHAARSYTGGETIDDAMSVITRLADEGLMCTIGYWDKGQDSPRQMTDIYLDCIMRSSGRTHDTYVSLKPPTLRFSVDLAVLLAKAARERSVRLHCDSHGPEVADLSNAMLQAMIDKVGGASLGTTLPGRWKRSLADADWAIEKGLNIRVVKGQWPDPQDPSRDLSLGFLEVIDRLAGRARHVAVATQDFALAREAIARLRAKGTSCELEMLFGMPVKPLIAWAKGDSVKARIYVPFGSGFAPSALRVLKRNPRLLYTIAKDRLLSVMR